MKCRSLRYWHKLKIKANSFQNPARASPPGSLSGHRDAAICFHSGLLPFVGASSVCSWIYSPRNGIWLSSTLRSTVLGPGDKRLLEEDPALGVGGGGWVGVAVCLFWAGEHKKTRPL